MEETSNPEPLSPYRDQVYGIRGSLNPEAEEEVLLV